MSPNPPRPANHFLAQSLEDPHVTLEDPNPGVLDPLTVHHYFLGMNDPFHHRPPQQIPNVCTGISWPAHHPSQQKVGMDAFMGGCCNWHDRTLLTAGHWEWCMDAIGAEAPTAEEVYRYGRANDLAWNMADVQHHYDRHTDAFGWFLENEYNTMMADEYDAKEFPPCP